MKKLAQPLTSNVMTRWRHSVAGCHTSTVFQTNQAIPCVDQVKSSEHLCKSQKLMLELGLIAPSSPGCLHLLPGAVRALEKLCRLIDHEMRAIGGRKIDMPSLAVAQLWRASGRWEAMGQELFRFKDRHDTDYCLAPITKKFRDEMKPRFGLLRGKEFYMKDMYSFDASEESAKETYEAVCEAYANLFQKLKLTYVKVLGTTGNIGGSVSHEFHLPASIGEDALYLCQKCSYQANAEVLDAGVVNPACPSCGDSLRSTPGIEVGHTFLLGTKYSSTFGASYLNRHGKPNLLQMGCFGLGVSRILAAAVEVLSTNSELRWPTSIAPYQVCVIPPKAGSKEAHASLMAQHLYQQLSSLPHLNGDVLLDDRGHLTIGRRLQEATRLGFPHVVICGKKSLEAIPLIEVHRTYYDEPPKFMTHRELFDYMEAS
ncbi:PREDICTED: probable proline--tRNA ligase, mitochondrial isoform X2 [Priapulus caudatus]|uniref:Probable proline--tRNA ligase, mitochondrial isoform X2 n=1 Tax=Priapulus caudatus TaxID=37621 RepID=A0ABM1EQT7_PRICU|nr:PREDICTED: probable proline--tRNA ligase, mitochondrial isoform X2 [Priapulus caudatus]